MEKTAGSSQRHIRYIDSECIDRDVDTSQLKAVPGTRNLHSLKPDVVGRVLHKRYSCFCDGCEAPGETCQSKYQEEWTATWLFAKSCRLRQVLEAAAEERSEGDTVNTAGADSGTPEEENDPYDFENWSDWE